MKFDFIHFDSISSTNTYARENASRLHIPVLISADNQTAGRGRHGKSFYSPAGTGIYFSLMFEAESSFDLITPAAAVCTCEAIQKFTGISAQIKWVNDIYLNSKKTAGILTERFESYGRMLTIVGIGVNLTTDVFPDELVNAGSLGVDLDTEAFAKQIADDILTLNTDYRRDEILEKYRERLFIIGKELEYTKDGELYSGVAVGINNECNLIVDTVNGRQILSSGEISVTLK